MKKNYNISDGNHKKLLEIKKKYGFKSIDETIVFMYQKNIDSKDEIEFLKKFNLSIAGIVIGKFYGDNLNILDDEKIEELLTPNKFISDFIKDKFDRGL